MSKWCYETYQQRATIQRHPDAILQVIADESHALNASGGSAVVWDPVIGPRCPGKEQVAARCNGYVVALVVTNLHQYCVI